MQYFGFDRPSFGIKTYGFGSSEFSPLDLFAGGKQGVWYDPSDKSTLFQDAAGTIPVTKDGDPVGLILDKSKGGGGFGTNLVPNGDFSSQNTNDWVMSTTDTAVSKEVIDGKLHITTNTVGSQGYFILTIPTVVGKRYLLKTDWVKVGGGRFYVGTAGSTTAYTAGVTNPTGYYTAVSDKMYLQVGATSGVITQIIGNISVREVQGNHATQTVSTSRPIYKTDGILHWLNFDGVDDYLLTTLAQVTRPLSVAFAKDEGVSPNGTATYITFNGGGNKLRRYATDYYLATFGSPATGVERHVGAPTKNVVSLILNNDKSALRFDNTVYPKVLGNSSLEGLMSVFSESDGASSVRGRMYGFIVSQTVNRNDMDVLHTYLSAKAGVIL